MFLTVLIVGVLMLLLWAGTAFPNLDPEPLPATPPRHDPHHVDPIELHRLADDGGPHVD